MRVFLAALLVLTTMTVTVRGIDIPVSRTPSAGLTAPYDMPRPTPSAVSRSHVRPPLSAGRSHRGSRGNAQRRTLSVTCYVATGHRTASGLWPRAGMAASNHHPFGTRLRVERVGVVTVRDRIGHSSDLDLFFNSRAACIKFGRQNLKVEVVR